MSLASINFCLHRCETLNRSDESSHFCQNCGAFLPKDSLMFDERGIGTLLCSKELEGEKVVRSRNYVMRDTHGANSANVLSQMIKKQSKNRYYNTHPHHLLYRRKVFDWMESLVAKFGYQQSTLHLAVGYFDAVLSLFTVTTAQIKLIAYICLFIAAKMEEKDEKIPLIEEAFKLFDKEFTSFEILNCEKLVFKILDYQLNTKTPYSFAVFFLSKGVLQVNEIPSAYAHLEARETFAKKLEDLVVALVSRSLRDYNFYQFTSIAVAAAAIALARKIMKIPNDWSKGLEELTLLSWVAIKDCVAMLEEDTQDMRQMVMGSPDKLRNSDALSTKENSPAQTVEVQPIAAKVNEFTMSDSN